MSKNSKKFLKKRDFNKKYYGDDFHKPKTKPYKRKKSSSGKQSIVFDKEGKEIKLTEDELEFEETI